MYAHTMRHRPGLKLKILRQCAVYPTSRMPYMPVLGQGSIVRVWNGGSSPTGIPHELAITYVDALGEQQTGWLEPYALVAINPRQKRKLRSTDYDAHEPISTLDILRDGSHKSGWKLWRLWVKFTKNFVPSFKRVIRELGGITKKSDDPDTLLIRMMRMTHDREVTMKDVEETRSTGKGKRAAEKTVTKGKAKASEAKKPKKAASDDDDEPSSRSNSMRVSCGNALVPLLEKGPARALAKRLQQDEALSKKDLVALREGVNEQAAAAREADDGKKASKLSAANRIVRRLARSA